MYVFWVKPCLLKGITLGGGTCNGSKLLIVNLAVESMSNGDTSGIHFIGYLKLLFPLRVLIREPPGVYCVLRLNPRHSRRLYDDSSSASESGGIFSVVSGWEHPKSSVLGFIPQNSVLGLITCLVLSNRLTDGVVKCFVYSDGSGGINELSFDGLFSIFSILSPLGFLLIRLLSWSDRGEMEEICQWYDLVLLS